MAPFSLWDREMLVGRLPVAAFGSDRLEVTSTAQLFGTEALGHPARHLRDVTKLCSFDEDALDAQAFEFPGRFRTSRRVQRWSCHTERLSTPESVVEEWVAICEGSSSYAGGGAAGTEIEHRLVATA